jgi:hypothetical protein
VKADIMTSPKLRILVIEPETSCADQLRTMLADRVSAEVIVAPTADDGCDVLRTETPDMVLLSAVCPPRAEEQVVSLLKWLDPYDRVPVLTIPPATRGFEVETDDTPRRSLNDFLRTDIRELIARLRKKRPAPQAFSYDPGMLVARIDDTLREARERKELPPPRLALPPAPEADTILVRVTQAPEWERTGLMIVPKAAPLRRIERAHVSRARRLSMAELPHRVTLGTRSGAVKMINLSDSGILFESPLKYTPDTVTALSLFGAHAKFDLPARIVRSEASTADSIGVSYLTAASFNEERALLTMLGAIPGEVLPPQKPLSDLLAQVTTELYEKGDYGEAQAIFDSFLRQFAHCQVRLAYSLTEPREGRESIHFKVSAPTRAILEATFDRGHEPSVEEFAMLKAAAAVASVLLQHEGRFQLAQTA